MDSKDYDAIEDRFFNKEVVLMTKKLTNIKVLAVWKDLEFDVLTSSHPSVTQIAEACSVAQPHVSRALTELCELKILYRVPILGVNRIRYNTPIFKIHPEMIKKMRDESIRVEFEISNAKLIVKLYAEKLLKSGMYDSYGEFTLDPSEALYNSHGEYVVFNYSDYTDIDYVKKARAIRSIV